MWGMLRWVFSAAMAVVTAVVGDYAWAVRVPLLVTAEVGSYAIAVVTIQVSTYCCHGCGDCCGDC